jgi:hypothetical protein
MSIKKNSWNEQHLTQGRMVAFRPKLSDKTRIGQVVHCDGKTANVEFAEGIEVVLADDLTPIFSKIAP